MPAVIRYLNPDGTREAQSAIIMPDVFEPVEFIDPLSEEARILVVHCLKGDHKTEVYDCSPDELVINKQVASGFSCEVRPVSVWHNQDKRRPRLIEPTGKLALLKITHFMLLGNDASRVLQRSDPNKYACVLTSSLAWAKRRADERKNT